ncbi:YjbH domain-containing protein [Profundibacterium mesophilum]|uniref:Bacterial putative lipoprotein domain containing protein n=1 Tax=Profundibacterium mesophilum KAUST100406-0324 TaxID=1037889 RepID=A0A921NSB8_9RHOB|nr:YjbH domain-containing protein [Profundibacterium mesophilum]KAF0676967.1 Bacterial putative lipoprotein domain containing protein [Profundibacterium mesophilum KAUST100406-0324]
MTRNFRSPAAIAMGAVLLSGTALASWSNGAGAEPRPTLGLYGTTGLVDMPSALSQPDGELTFTSSYFAGINRNTLSFQILPRVQGSFRYSGYHEFNYAGFEDYYDRSFDLSFQFFDESRYLPAMKIGLQDFVGTGISSGEYIVATKHLGPKIAVTAGLGWGRLGSEGDIGSPFGARPARDFGRGGKPNTGEWFKGPAAPFAGLSYKPSEALTLLAEYSSDAYRLETNGRSASRLFAHESPFNFGVDYAVNDTLTVGGYYLYGSEIGLRFSLALNPARPAVRGSVAAAPGALAERPDPARDPDAYFTAWAARPGVLKTLRRDAHAQLLAEGIEVTALSITEGRAELRFRNLRYDAEAQAIGRAARVLSRVMPPSVETFVLVPTVFDIGASAVTLRRSDLERLVEAPDAEAQLFAVAGLGAAGPRPGPADRPEGAFPKLTYSIGPFVRSSFFDPSSPVRAAFGLSLGASYTPRPGLVFSGAVEKKLLGNLDEGRPSNSVLPHVRTDVVRYEREGDPALRNLFGAYYFRPSDDLYGRVTAGYLERMFGGVSGELLYKPVSSPLGLGLELNYAAKRDFDGGFGFQDYDVLTGHVSAYYDFDNGFHGQLDVGRYLAGDVGATLSLDREFRNGWSVGAFATLTDVSAEEFGEGSFDKGIRISIPLSYFTGTPTRGSIGRTIRPITRDGGARLSVPGRLYEGIRDYHEGELADQWGRVWR